MFHIQWFPGHMTKALRMMEKNIKVIDSVIYVLDARAVSACFNPKFDKVIGDRPILYVLNKCDMVKSHELKKWTDYFDSKGCDYVISNSTSNRYAKEIINKLKINNQKLIDRYKEKGVNRSIRSMVLGVPNTGKSTLINSLSRGKRTITGNRPGVTRGKQWISISEHIDLIDTPGTMSPNYENQELAFHLACIGSVNDEILVIEDLALELLKILMVENMESLKARYKIEGEFETALEVYEAIALKRGFIMRGREIDYTRCAKAILDDFRKTRIDKIMLEFPQE